MPTAPPPACPACHRLPQLRAGADPSLIAELRESFAVLHDHQPYEGWCVLLLKDHVEHLHQLPKARRAALAEDMGQLAEAIAEAFNPRRINYECLGNQMSHIHWHLIPRYEPPKDPDPKNVVWLRPKSELDCGVSPEKRQKLIFSLQKAGKGWQA
jgi:diadenosine tetraphosphate (Ap4A) HIT family hydrolase